MKRSFVVIILFYFIAHFSLSQEVWRIKRCEAIAGIGTTQFFGDIGGFSKTENILGFKDISVLQTRFNIDLGFKYKIMKDLNVRLNLVYGMLHATDNRGSNEYRNYDARTSIFEPTVIGEYYFIKSRLGDSYLFSAGKKTNIRRVFAALEFYAFTGIGGLSYNVKGNDNLVARGLKNKGFTAVIPAGFGTNILFQPDYNLGLEIGGRYAFSDYLDGYTSQYSSSNDVYYFLTFTFTYKIRTNSKGVPLFLGRRRY